MAPRERRAVLTSILPAQFMDCSLVGPVPNFLRQPRPHRILLHIKPFLRIALLLSQPMMKSVRLPHPIGMAMRFAESAFPKRNPPFYGERQIARRSEQMQMVRHQNIVSNQPGGGLTPCSRKHPMRLFASQPVGAILRADRHQDKCRLIEINVNAFRRLVAYRFFL